VRLEDGHAIADVQIQTGQLESGAWDDDVTVEFVAPGDGEFSKPDKNLIVSREGFSVRSRAPNSVFYLEAGRELLIFVEMLMTESVALTTRRSDTHGWPGPDGPLDLPDAERTRIIRNAQRALAWEGTTLVVT